MNRSIVTLTALFDALNSICTVISDDKAIKTLLPIHYNPRADCIERALLLKIHYFLSDDVVFNITKVF